MGEQWDKSVTHIQTGPVFHEDERKKDINDGFL